MITTLNTYKVEFLNRDRRVVVEAREDRYILETAENSGLVLPYGCRYGGCITCAARLIEGQVDQSEGKVLKPTQKEEGYVLLCVAYPRSDCVFEVGAEAQAKLFNNPFKNKSRTTEKLNTSLTPN